MVDGEVNLTSGESAIPGKATASVDLTKLAASPRVKPDGGIMAPMVSYAQNFEDVMLRRALQDIESGFYVDIGAADPDLDSVTRWFYSNGWRGINVEPDPRYYLIYTDAHRDAFNPRVEIHVLVVAASCLGGLVDVALTFRHE